MKVKSVSKLDIIGLILFGAILQNPNHLSFEGQIDSSNSNSISKSNNCPSKQIDQIRAAYKKGIQSERGEAVSFVAAEEGEEGGGGGGGGEAAGFEEMIAVGHGGEVVEAVLLRQAPDVEEILDGVGVSVVDIEAEEAVGIRAPKTNPTHKQNQQNILKKHSY